MFSLSHSGCSWILEHCVNLSSHQRYEAFTGNKGLQEDIEAQNEKPSPPRQLQNKLKPSVSSTNRRRIDFSASPPPSLDLVLSSVPSICCLSLNFPPTPVLYHTHFFLFHFSVHSRFVSICRVSFNFFPPPFLSLTVHPFLSCPVSPHTSIYLFKFCLTF